MSTASRLVLHDIAWERVQLIVRARIADGPDGAFDPEAFRLRQVSGDIDPGTLPTEMLPTRTRRTDDVLTVHWNVMTGGPDQMPLEPGRWRLEWHGSPIPVHVTDASILDPARSAARFDLARGTYRATPTTNADGTFDLEVTLDLADPAELARRRPGNPAVRLVKRSISRIRKTVFRLTYRVARLVVRLTPGRRANRRVVFASDSRAELGGNLQVVHDRMVARGLDHTNDLLTLFRASITEHRSVRDRFRMPWLLATADVILVDDYIPVIYRLDDPDLRIIQLWHASGAFKTVGYSRVGKPGGPSPYSRIHKNYTHAIVSSDHDVPFYAEAFGIPESRVVPTGIPRMDRFFDEAARAEGREAALAAFPMARGRTTILFAPTFRGETPRTATYDAALIDYAALHALAVEKDAVVIFKMHPFVREPLAIPEALGDRLVDGTTTAIDVNDLLFVVDLLITDYSSIVFEFSTLGRPMLFFAYDLEAYVAERDFYVPFEAFVPGRIVRTFPDLLDAIRRDDYEQDKVDAFAHRHFAHLDGSSTDRVIDELVIGR